MDKQLPAVVQGNFQISTLEDAMKMGDLFIKAGLFEVTEKDEKAGMSADKKQAIAAVKVIAGAGMGLSPFAAMAGLHVIKGKVTQSYQTMLAMLRKTPGYDYKILKADIDEAQIEFFRNGESLGVSTFNENDIKRAGMGGNPMHAKYPKQMKLARAVTFGINAFCPEVLQGPGYTPEDFGEVVDVSEEAPAAEAPQKPAPKPDTKPKQNAASAATGTASVKTSNAKSATASSDTTATAQSSAPSPQSTGNDTVDVDEVSEEARGGVPPSDRIADILQAGVNNGWSEEELETWLGGFLEDNGVDMTDDDTVFSTWTWKHIEGAIEYVSTNKPEQ